jgi:hypothetical protein
MNFRTAAPLAALAVSLTGFALLVGCGKPALVDASGTWKLTPNTNSLKGFQPTLKIQAASGHLTGTLSYQGTLKVLERPIRDVRVEGDELFFTVTIPSITGSGADMNRKYRGRITGDSITGMCDVSWAGQPFSREWGAKRVKE